MTWRDVLLKAIDPTFAPLLTIADPHGLFRDTEVHLEITRRGYTILPYDDPIVFRVAYEEYLAADDGMPPLLVMLWGPTRTLKHLPADVLARSVQRQISLSELFPRLHIPYLVELDFVRLDRLWAVYGQQRGPLLSLDDTATAILQTGYAISLTALQTSADALNVLLHIHFAPQPLPAFLLQVILHQLESLPDLASWPVQHILHDRAAFDAFLARAWPRFLHERGHLTIPSAEVPGLKESAANYDTAPLLPFDDPHIWPAIDTLFLSGRLQPLAIPAGSSIQQCYAIGVKQPDAGYATVQRDHLMAQLHEQCPTTEAHATDWLALAPLIGTLMRWTITNPTDQSARAMLEQLQTLFTTWMQHRYAALRTMAPLPRPVLVSHLPHLLAQERMHDQRRIALLVLDGLALDQWLVLRDSWAEQGRDFVWDERALFAWVPTLTAISRQALFAGAPPQQFAASLNQLNQTDHEAAYWRRFWSDHQLHRQSVAYLKGLHGLEPHNGATELARVDDLLSNPHIQVIGLVVDAVDRIAHGMQQGEAGMLQQVGQWAAQGWCAELIIRLRDAGFQVIVTADHGNTAACGIGRVQDGILAEERGQRARIYANTTLRDRALASHPDLSPWDRSGLPSSLSVLLAPSGQAFAPAGHVIVTHGGIDMREVLVPWCVLQ
jgi:hypothetical protein